MNITAKTIGKLIGRSQRYVYRLLRRKGLNLKEIDYWVLTNLVAEYRYRTWVGHKKNGLKTFNLKHQPIKKISAQQRIDKILYGWLFKLCREWAGGKCTVCDNPGTDVHHIDGRHGNMIFENLMFICFGCHWALHRGDIVRIIHKRVNQNQSTLNE